MRDSLSVQFTVLFLLVLISTTFSQQPQSALVDRMRLYEHNILDAYLEYQKLYYEDKSREHELQAFENLLTVYISQVTEIYKTLNLSEVGSEVPRDITSRCLVFKNLMYLEKAPLNIEYYEKACYEYYEALSLYDGTNIPPAIYKELPQPIQSGDRIYFRLIDLLADKGLQLGNFGKVKISFRNFMVTANFDPEMLELIKVENKEEDLNQHFTYLLAETRIKHAFAEVFTNPREVETYVALPRGTYILRLNSGRKSQHSALTRFYVRANQEQHYIMEPLADWIILYENPRSKRPDYYKFRRTHQNTDSLAATDGLSNGHTNVRSKERSKNDKNALDENHLKLVSEIVSQYLSQFADKLSIDLSSADTRENAVQIFSESIVAYVESGAYYNTWNDWTASWEISNKVLETLGRGSKAPIAMIELVYQVLLEI